MLPPFTEWRKANIKQFPYGKRRQAKEEYQRLEKEQNEMLSFVTVDSSHTHSYTIPCKTATPPSSFACKPCPVTISTDYPVIKEEGNNPMNSYASATIAAPTTETQDQRKYLERRLQEVYNTKRDPLESKFGLTDDEAPKDAVDFKKRIEAGQFTFREYKDGRWFYWADAIKWRDPAKKEDMDGFNAAKADLKAKKQAALDIIKINDPADGLKAIKDLESWEPTGAAN